MGDQMLGSLYLLMAAMIVMSALISRRTTASKMVVMALAWIVIFAGGFAIFTFRDELGYFAARLRTEATGAPIQTDEGIHIPMAIDGHFWVDGSVNDIPVRFLIDSGATFTTIGPNIAQQAGLHLDRGSQQIVQTGNGPVGVIATRAARMTIGPISRSDVAIHVASDEVFAVLGMNYLSTLKSWRVEGRWLILQPK